VRNGIVRQVAALQKEISTLDSENDDAMRGSPA
jgi:hypothetical protein